jgi:hypothetical protein
VIGNFERQCFRTGQNLDASNKHFYISGNTIRITLPFNTHAHNALCLDNIFLMQTSHLVSGITRGVAVNYQLRNAIAIAQINKVNGTMVATVINPAT